MATRSEFTDEQWEVLGFAVEDTMMLVAVANGPKFFESMAEIGATAKFMADSVRTSRSTLVRDLAGGIGIRRDKQVAGDSAGLESRVLSRVADAVAIVTQVAPDELDAFKEFVVEVAQSAAEARNGVDEQEANVIDKIKSALI